MITLKREIIEKDNIKKEKKKKKERKRDKRKKKLEQIEMLAKQSENGLLGSAPEKDENGVWGSAPEKDENGLLGSAPEKDENGLIGSAPEEPEIKKNVDVDTRTQLVAIYKSVKQNYIFYIVMFYCLYCFTKYTHQRSSLFLTFVSIIFITFYGYTMHFFSHYLQNRLSENYKKYNNILTRNKYINWIFENLIYFCEFHHKTHHDTDINKQYKNIALEFINNLASQGVLLIIVKYGLNLLDNRVILLWAFFYATVHNINYLYVKPSTHMEHHMNDRTNYGIDIWDIIMGSKHEWSNIETHNHTSINLLAITAIIIYLSNRFKL